MKQSIAEDRASLSYVDSFERMMKRNTGGQSAEAKFTLTEQSLKQPLFVSEIVFTGEVPWLILIQPSSGDKSKFDLVMSCHTPRALYYSDWEINACIKLVAPKPISAVTKIQTFDEGSNQFIIPQFLSEQSLNGTQKNPQKGWDFKVSIDLKKIDVSAFTEDMEDITSVQLAENIPYFYGVDEPRDPPICEDWFAVVGNLFREESFRLCTPIEWHLLLKTYFDFLVEKVVKKQATQLVTNLGFTDLLVPLVTADYSSGSVSSNTAHVIISLLASIFCYVPVKDVNSVITSFTVYIKALAVVLQRKRYLKESCISFITVEILPDFQHLAYRKVIAKELLPDALTFYKQENITQLYSWHPHSCRNRHIVTHSVFMNHLPLQLITSGYFKTMTKGFLKRYLTVLANNKLNPYFAQTTQNLSYNNIARLLKVHTDADILQHWVTWIKDHAESEPLLMDLVPPKIAHEIPFTDQCGCFEYPEDMTDYMPIYMTVYNKYYDDVMTPLNDFIEAGSVPNTNTKTLLAKVTKTKDKGNDHFKNKEYYDALDQYDQALDDLTHFSVAHDNSEVTLLTTMVRNNRVTTFIELGENENAIADSTLTLRELWYLEHETKNNKDNLEAIMNRAEKCRYRRVKALQSLKLWPHALKNCLEMIDISSRGMRKVVMPLYYECLTKYIKTSRNVQYPFMCISCSSSKDPLSFQQLKRCGECRHPYCSTECQKKDWDIHKKFCHKLSRVRENLRSKH